MKIMKLILSGIIILMSATFFAQDIQINDIGSPFMNCAGNFYDSGGPGGEAETNAFYSNDETNQITICPDQPGYLLRLIFSQFNVEIGDQFTVYDGDNTSAPLLGIFDDASLVSGDTIQATTSNTSGCLTIVFTTDDIKTGAGWAAAISCFYPCQLIQATALFEGNLPGGIIRLCKGDTLNFTGAGLYPENDLLYNQSDLTSSFQWAIEGETGNGSATGTDAEYIFNTDGIFHINLTITDNNPNNVCQNSNLIDQLVHVSTTPIFAGTTADLPQICIGETNEMLGVVTPVEADEDCIPPVGQPAFIPDGSDMGSGLTYLSTTKIKCYSDQFIDDITDISSLCLNIEHSAVGDLDIRLTCPNGQSIVLLEFNGTDNTNTQWLGQPIDIFGNIMQGVGEEYCFTMGATQSINDAAASVPNNNTIPAGDFLPFESFAGLIGCPINGTWTISIRDRIVNDNGWVIGWQMEFDPSIVPTLGNSFTPTIVSTIWMDADPATPAIIAQNPPNATVLPEEPGTACYMFQVTDDFGCNYDTTVCFIVNPNVEAAFTYPSDPYCASGPSVSPTFIGDAIAGTFTVSPATGLSINPTTGVISPAASTAGTYTVTNTVPGINGCPDVAHTFDVTILPIPEPIIVGDLDYCLEATLTTDQPYVSYEWSTGLTSQGGTFTEADNAITVTVVGTNGCIGTSDPVNVNQIAQNVTFDTLFICQGASATIHGNIETTAGVYAQFFNTGSFCDSVSNVTLIVFTPVNGGNDVSVCIGETVTLTGTQVDTYSWSPVVQNGVPFTPALGTTIYTVTGTDTNNCVTTDQVSVTANPLPTVEAGANQVICEGEQVTLSGSGSPTNTYIWDNGVIDNTAFSPASTTVYTVTGTDENGCVNTDLMSVTVNPLPIVNAGSNLAVCAGESVTLNPTGNADVYVWDNGAQSGVTFVPVATTTYTLTGTITATGCENTSTITVTVNQNPIVDAGSDQTICANQPITLSGSGASTYVWDNNVTDGVAFTPTSDLTYTVIGTDANGCTGTDQVTVSLTQLEDSTFTYPTSTYCLTGDANPTATVTGVPGGTFTATGGMVIDPATGLIDIAATGAGVFDVTYTTPGACPGVMTVSITITDIFDATFTYQDPSCQIGSVTPNFPAGSSGGVFTTADAGLVLNSFTGEIDLALSNTGTFSITNTIAPAGACAGDDHTAQITINPLPIVTAIVSDNEICVGEQVILTGGGAVTYDWNNGLGAGETHSVAPTSTTTYTVTGTDANNCSNTASVSVTVNPLPIVNAGADFELCVGGPVTLSGTGNADTYVWDNFVTDGVAFTPTVGVVTYTVIGTNTTTTCINSDQIQVTVHALPIIDAGSDQTLCENSPITLTGSGGNPGSYIWDNNVFDGISFVPTNTLTYTVSGTDGNGCTNTDNVTIAVDPLPSIGAGADQTICVGESVTLTGTGGNGYDWDNNLGAGVSHVVTPTTTTTYIVSAQSDINLCSNTDTVTIFVNPLPTVTTNADETICVGESVILEAQGADTYDWDNGIGAGSTHTVSPTATTTYIVTGTDINGCENTASVTITVNQLPSINAGVDDAICEGESFTLTATGGTTYTWDNNLGAGATHTVTPTATTTYIVTGTDGTTTCSNTDQVTITVNPNPIVNAGNDATICAGQSTTLTATGTVASYSWDNGLGTGATHSVSPTSTTTYEVTATIVATGCQSTDQVTVTVNALPIVSISGTNEICIGTSTTLTANGATDYIWNNGLGNGQTQTVSPTTTTSYIVTGEDLNGCANTANITVTVNPLPIINAGNDITICLGQEVDLTATGGVSYDWDNGGGTGSPSTVTPGASTTYTVTATDANGCVNTDQMVVTVVAAPNPVITADVTVSTPTLNVVFTNSSTNANSYTWNLGDGSAPINTTTLGTQNGSYSNVGIYNVTLTAANDFCAVTDTIQVQVIPFTNAFIHIPNVFTPNGDNANDEWWIDVQNGKEIAVQVFNRWGNLMIEMNDFTTKWDGTKDGTDASEGTYFFKYRIVGDDDGVLEGHGNITLIRAK
jgi:gliding motility-associated-like protein